MESRDRGAVLKSVHTLFSVGTASACSDGELLERFMCRSDDGAEVAFAALVERHGPMRIVSPIDGIVTRRGYHVGEYVRSAADGRTAPLRTIVNNRKLRVVANVPDSDVPFLDKGDPARVEIRALGSRVVYRGTVARIAVAEDLNTRTLRTEIDLDNADGRLRPGQ